MLLEAAHQTAQRLRAGSVPGGFPVGTAEARQLGEVGHTRRNYLALGALRPTPSTSRQVVQWALDVWEEIDAEFVSKWEKWIDPISTNWSRSWMS